MKSLEFEIRIGLFVLVGLILLTVITFSIGDFFFKPGYTLNVILGFANGVEQSAPVRLAGVEVGEVKETGVFKDEKGNTKVKLKLWLTNDAKVEEDAKVVINTLGLIGEKYVEIMPGTPGKRILGEGDIVGAVDSISVEQMTKKGYDIALKLEKAVDSLDSILAQIKSGEGTMGKLVYDDTLYNETEGLMKDLRANPWKLLQKPGRAKKKTENELISAEGNKGNF